MSEANSYDSWLKDGGPAALVIRELLEPVEGRDGVFSRDRCCSRRQDKVRRRVQHQHIPRRESHRGTVAAMLRDGRLKPTIAYSQAAEHLPRRHIGSQANRIETISPGLSMLAWSLR